MLAGGAFFAGAAGAVLVCVGAWTGALDFVGGATGRAGAVAVAWVAGLVRVVVGVPLGAVGVLGVAGFAAGVTTGAAAVGAGA